MGISLRRMLNCMTIGALVISTLLAPAAIGAAPHSYQDLHYSYAQKEIMELSDLGLLSGYPDGTFRPDQDMTRSELAKIISLSAGLTAAPEKAGIFTDVPSDSWFAGYVGALVASGVTQGTSSTTFSPEDKVTRQELVVFFIRALGLGNISKTVPLTDKLSDLTKAADWAQPAVSLACRIGLVNGIQGADGTVSFNPHGYADRQAMAKLAYEVKLHASSYKTKAEALEKEQSGGVPHSLDIIAVKATDNTTIEVTFGSELTDVRLSDFAFDHNLTVASAALKSGSKTVVVLKTSSQVAGSEYTLTFRGSASKLKTVGVGAFGGGGGGGGFGGGGGGGIGAGSTVADKLASGRAQDTITVTASGIYGPASGTPTTVKKLTLDPGSSGEVTLRNVNPEVLEVLSGDVNSIKLENAVIKQLKVNAVNNGGRDLRIEVKGTTTVEETQVQSQAILEGSSPQATLGSIRLLEGTAGKKITLKGRIDSPVNVLAAGALISIGTPTTGNPLVTTVRSIQAGANASLETAVGTTLDEMAITSPNTALSITGPGVVQALKVPGSSTGTRITLGASAAVQQLQADAQVSLDGNPASIAGVYTTGSGSVLLDPSVEPEVKAQAIRSANEGIAEVLSHNQYTSDLAAKTERVNQMIAIAFRHGAIEPDLLQYSWYTQYKGYITDLTRALQAVSIQFQGEDTAESVTRNVNLLNPTLPNGNTVWSSSGMELVAFNGQVYRPAAGAGDAKITLTATIFTGPMSASKTFTLVVKQKVAHPVEALTLRPDLLLVAFDEAIANPAVSEFVFDRGLKVTGVTHYPQFQNVALLNVTGQQPEAVYHLSYKGVTTEVQFTGSSNNLCTNNQTCVLPGGRQIPIPGVPVPGGITGQLWVSGTSEPVHDALVTLYQGSSAIKSTRTDSSGWYTFTGIEPGVAFTLKASKDLHSEASTLSEVTIASGEVRLLAPLFMERTPSAVTSLTATWSPNNAAYLMWSSNTYTGVTYKLYQDGQLVREASVPFAEIPNLRPETTYTFTVIACNAAGCSDPASVTYTASSELSVLSAAPYSSVTGTVYGDFTRTAGINRFLWADASPSQDSVLVKLGDTGGTPGQQMRGTISYDHVKVESFPSYQLLSSEKININGQDYLKIQITGAQVRPYIQISVTGLMYTVNGKQYIVAPFMLVLTNN
ncbi:S-layer homology domain-containing protein [Gorillibacterium sp. sgz5001074]|uniref:S-layer homology domain-containing protein n=1 Tax=Gorillibacterium sp. sgz5001074 TaxID=3446695 RepID=UPI003F669FAD